MPREKYRVHEVAKDFGLNSKKILAILDTHMPAERTHMAALEDRELDIIFETVTQENAVASFDAYFAAGESKKAEETKKPEAAAAAKEEKFPLGKYEFHPAKCSMTCTSGGENIKLAARESAVLEYLCRNMGNTVEASAILKDLWGDDNFFNLRSLNVYITRLRGHLKEAPEVEIISTRGVGYRIEVRN